MKSGHTLCTAVQSQGDKGLRGRLSTHINNGTCHSPLHHPEPDWPAEAQAAILGSVNQTGSGDHNAILCHSVPLCAARRFPAQVIYAIGAV